MSINGNFKEIFCFIHASDIHLGSNQYRNDFRAYDFIRAFQEILDLGLIHHVDFILLGGDVFTETMTFENIQEGRGLITGNHG